MAKIAVIEEWPRLTGRPSGRVVAMLRKAYEVVGIYVADMVGCEARKCQGRSPTLPILAANRPTGDLFSATAR